MNKSLFILLIGSSIAFVYGKKCPAGHFACKSGNKCIKQAYRCDDFEDCDDKSDEAGCLKVCKPPRRFRNGKAVLRGNRTNSGLLPGSFVKHKCNRGYRLIGSKKRVCLENGELSGFVAKCLSKSNNKVFCPVPKPLNNGTIKNNRLSENSEIIYECDENFELEGPRVRICQSNGRWSTYDPYCQPNSCMNPGPISNGTFTGSGFKKGYSLIYICDPGFQMIGGNTIVCLDDGSWNDNPPRCISKVEAFKLSGENLKENFVNKLKYLTVDSRGRSAGLVPVARGLDLVFVVDYSSSVGEANFKKSLEFVDSMIDYFGISQTEQGTHVALIVFGSEPKLIFNLKSEKIYEKDEAIAAMKYIKFSGGGTGTRYAFDVVRRNVMPEARANAKKVLFLLTDGNYNVGGDPQHNAKYLRDKGFEIFTVGISGYVDRAKLEEIASLPFYNHVWLLKEYDMLKKLKDMVNKTNIDYETCGRGGDTQSKNPSQDVTVANHGAWPWTVTVHINSRMKCAGVLIKEEWVLTAASCVKGSAKENIEIFSGIYSRSSYKGTEQPRGIERIESDASKGGALVLLKLKTKVELNDYTRKICLPDNYDYLAYVRNFKKAFVSGWGSGEVIYFRQRQGILEFKNVEKCKGAFKDLQATKNLLCTETSGNATCTGTLGSPLMVHRRRVVAAQRRIYSWILVGILQENHDCEKQRLAAFIDVHRAKRWIEDTIRGIKKDVKKDGKKDRKEDGKKDGKNLYIKKAKETIKNKKKGKQKQQKKGKKKGKGKKRKNKKTQKKDGKGTKN